MEENRTENGIGNTSSEAVHSRRSDESLSDYLRDVNSYIEKINSSYAVDGEKTVPAEEAPAEEAFVFSAREEQTAPETEETGFPADFGSVYEESVTPGEAFAPSSPEFVIPAEDPAPVPAAAAPAKEPGKLEKLLGNYRFSAVMTAVNVIYGVFWLLSYIISAFARESFFDNYQANMAAKGIAAYHVELSSPFFGFIRVLLYLLTVVIILWTVAVVLADKKKKTLPGKKLLFTAFGIDLAIGITAIIDAASVGLLFT